MAKNTVEFNKSIRKAAKLVLEAWIFGEELKDRLAQLEAPPMLDLSSPPPESSITVHDFGVWGTFLEKSTWRYTARGGALLATTPLLTYSESNEPPVD